MKKLQTCFLLSALLCFLLVIGISFKSHAQSAKSSDYRNNPVWVEMMSDPHVNYFEAVKAYEEFWKHHEKPQEEDELIGEKGKDRMDDHKYKKGKREKQKERERNNDKKTLTNENMKALEWKQEMTYQCKRFEDWMRTVKPFVQNDGHILSSEEQMKMYERRQEELKKGQH